MAALVVPGRWATEIDGIRRALASAEIDRIPPHVTLVPPANVQDEHAGAAFDLVRSVSAAFAPLALDIGPAGTFLPRNPVCYLAVGGDPPSLAALASLVASLATGPLAPPPGRRSRPFVPHVTLNQHMNPGRIGAALEVLEGYRAHVVFEGVTLLQHDEGDRRWNVLFEAFFEGAAVVGRGGLEVELSLGDRPDPETVEWSYRAWEQYDSQVFGRGVGPSEPFAVTARVSGEIAGLAEGSIQGITCRLAGLMVSPEWRGSGVGTKLLQAVEQHARARGCTRVRLETMVGERSELFYRGRGYGVTVTLPRWRELRDFVVMERDL